MSKVVVGPVLGRRGKADGRLLDFVGIEDGKGWFDGAFVDGLAFRIIVQASLWEAGLCILPVRTAQLVLRRIGWMGTGSPPLPKRRSGVTSSMKIINGLHLRLHYLIYPTRCW